MPKNKVSEWSSTPSNNTDIGGINIAEGCAPSGINNAIRELMAQVKDQQAGTDGDGFVVAGTLTCSGAAIMSSNVTMGDASTDAHTLNGSLTGATASKILLDDSVTTATAPALAFDGDTNTGIYRPAADTLSIATNGAERFRVANAGVIINQAMTCSGAAVMSSTVDVSGAATFTSTVGLGASATATTPTVSDNSTTVATTAFVKAALATIYPVGSIYTNATNSTNPGTLLGFGTWTAFGAGRVMVGFNASDALFDTAEETGGSKDAIVVSHTHTATVTDPGHSHEAGGTSGVTGGAVSVRNTNTNGNSTTTSTTGITVSNSTTGSSGTNANLPPYITVYMWKRTA